MRGTWYSSFQGHSRAVFALRDSKSEEWEKLEMIVSRVVASYLRKLEEFRIQSSLHITKPQRQLIELESNTYIGANKIFFSLQLPPFLPKIITVKPFFLH